MSKIVQALMVCRCYGPQEDVGQAHVFSTVTGKQLVSFAACLMMLSLSITHGFAFMLLAGVLEGIFAPTLRQGMTQYCGSYSYTRHDPYLPSIPLPLSRPWAGLLSMRRRSRTS